jgi:hypothetical protein
MTVTPLRFFMVAIAGWMNRQQQEAVSYLREENRILREKLGHKRILLSDAQKRRLARAAVKLHPPEVSHSPLDSYAGVNYVKSRESGLLPWGGRGLRPLCGSF